MLVLKAIGKTIGGVLLTLLMLTVFGALFIGACIAIGFVLKWMHILLATIVPGFAAFTTALGNSIEYILLGLAIIGVLFVFGYEVRDEYKRLKVKAEREAALE